MPRQMISEHQWSKLAPILEFQRVHVSVKTRSFIEAVLWKLRAGAPWRELPECFGPYSTIFNRFNRWSKKACWRSIFHALNRDADNEWNSMDATVIKAHQHSKGAAGKSDEGIGKSIAGNTSKIHMLCDAHGNPIDFVITGGQVHDSKVAATLIKACEAENLMADRAYHSSAIRQQCLEKGIQPIIPIKKNTVDELNLGFDSHLFKQRHVVENLFARLKHFRSIATRFDKTLINYSSMIFLACAYIWSKF